MDEWVADRFDRFDTLFFFIFEKRSSKKESGRGHALKVATQKTVISVSPSAHPSL